LRDNGAIEGAAAGFAEDDEVIVKVKYDRLEARVVAHTDGVRSCNAPYAFFRFTFSGDLPLYGGQQLIATYTRATGGTTTSAFRIMSTDERNYYATAWGVTAESLRGVTSSGINTELVKDGTVITFKLQKARYVDQACQDAINAYRDQLKSNYDGPNYTTVSDFSQNSFYGFSSMSSESHSFSDAELAAMGWEGNIDETVNGDGGTWRSRVRTLTYAEVVETYGAEVLEISVGAVTKAGVKSASARQRYKLWNSQTGRYESATAILCDMQATIPVRKLYVNRTVSTDYDGDTTRNTTVGAAGVSNVNCQVSDIETGHVCLYWWLFPPYAPEVLNDYTKTSTLSKARSGNRKPVISSLGILSWDYSYTESSLDSEVGTNQYDSHLPYSSSTSSAVAGFLITVPSFV